MRHGGTRSSAPGSPAYREFTRRRGRDPIVASRSRAGGDIRSIVLLASETAGPEGWRVAGYQAQGPGAGPLVVGALREALVERNVL